MLYSSNSGPSHLGGLEVRVLLEVGEFLLLLLLGEQQKFQGAKACNVLRVFVSPLVGKKAKKKNVPTILAVLEKRRHHIHEAALNCPFVLVSTWMPKRPLVVCHSRPVLDAFKAIL